MYRTPFYYKQTLHNKERINVSIFFAMHIFDAPFINEIRHCPWMPITLAIKWG